MDIQGMNIADRGDTKHKDPEVGACLTCFRFSKEANVAGTKQTRGRAMKYEGIEISRNHIRESLVAPARTLDFTLNNMGNRWMVLSRTI